MLDRSVLQNLGEDPFLGHVTVAGLIVDGAAVSAQGRMQFMISKGEVTSKKFLNFLERLMASETNPVFLIVQFTPRCGSKSVQSFVASSHGALKVFKVPEQILAGALFVN